MGPTPRRPQNVNSTSSSAEMDVADFFRQNTWANLQLISACSGLTDDQLDVAAEGTFGPIRDTFVHILTSEAGYARRLGVEPNPGLPWDEDWPGFDALTEMATTNGRAFVEAAPRAGHHLVVVGGDRGRYEAQTAVIAVQAFHHSTEHRSQIATVLTTLGMEPPEMSSWEWGITTGRMSRIS